MAVVAALAVALAGAGVSQAQFQIEPGSFEAGTFREDGTPETQAGAHPYRASTTFDITPRDDGRLSGYIHDVTIDLPPGLSGDPEAVTKCPRRVFAELMATLTNEPCPADSQVGVALIADRTYAFEQKIPFPVYLVEAPDGTTAQIGIPVILVPVVADISVDASRDYALKAGSYRTSQGVSVSGVSVTLWGYPNDPVHDSERFCGKASDGQLPRPEPCSLPPRPIKPFLTNPSDCGAGPLVTGLSVDQWAERGLFHTASVESPAIVGCERLVFEPSFEAGTDSVVAGSPSGLRVELGLPQVDDPQTGLGRPPLRDAVVRLPEGVSINPSGGDGLEACTDGQLGLRSDAPVECPLGSKIGTVTAETPVLKEQLSGSLYVRSQNSGDPESGEMFRVALVVESEKRGIRVKLPGQVRANSQTGRLEATFADNPQLPVSRVQVRLKTGPRAPLALPQDCGERRIEARLSSWAGQSVDLSSGLDVQCPAGHGGFDPAFAGGSLSGLSGEFAAFTAQIDRPDGDEYLSGVKVDLPEGVLAKLRGVELCPDAAADGGSCPAGSRVGTATVSAGAGSAPFFLKGDVYLTGPYKGAPYGLATHVHAKAGPFDLDWVRVRQALHVDPESARVSAVSDPLPQIVKGVPVRLRSVDVDVDRPRFAVNPTSCAAKTVEATLTSIQGSARTVGQRYRATDCAALGFKPKLAMRLSGRKQTRTGGHPSLRAVVSQGDGQANIAGAQVTLPPSVVLDPINTNDPKLLCGYDESLKADCPASSVIGTATANTPLLDKPLTGKVHLVQGIKFGKTGNRIRTTPSLLVKLRGQVDINLRARTTATGGRLVTTFPQVPDARVSRFAMNINGGSKGILVVTRTRRGKIDLCSGRQTAAAEIDGHNGKAADFAVAVKTPCAAKAARKAKKSKRR